MGIFIDKKKHTMAAAITLMLCVIMIIFSDILLQSAKKGILLWLSSVLPAMLPFFVCVNFLTGIGVINLLPVKVFPFAMSALSGYPVGAKVIGDLCRNKVIDDIEARRLISFCSTSGPIFMVGAVGVGMLGSQTAGYVIAVSHYIGALINGILYSFIYKGNAKSEVNDARIQNGNMMDVITSSIFHAFKSMAVILAYIIFFVFVMDIIDLSGIMNFFRNSAVESLLRGAVEMTVGCSSAAELGFDIKYSSIMASVIISWGGLSIIGQQMSMLSGTGISLKYLILTKMTHASFAGTIALFLGNLML